MPVASPRPRPSKPGSKAKARPEVRPQAGRRPEGPTKEKPEKAGRAPRAGTIALVGRPNVGKSTLLNQLLGERIAITSHHPQTTRDRVAGILTTDDTQYVFQDTPGLHTPRNRLGKRMNDVAQGTASACDVVVLVTDVGPSGASEIRPEDLEASAAIPPDKPVVLVVNKIDRLKEKAKLLEVLERLATLRDFTAIVPTSARTRDGFPQLLEVLRDLLPEGEPLHPPDDISDRPVRFFVAELVREQILARTREEVPHGVAVTVDAYEEPASTGASSVPKRSLTRITLTIHVAKESHKGIIIGKGGKMLEAIGSAARERTEALIGRRVHLDVKVRATPGWFDDAGRLADLGYAADDVVKKPKRKVSAGRGASR